MSIYDFIFMKSGRTTPSKSSENCSSYACVPGKFVSNDPLHSGGENKKEGLSLFETWRKTDLSVMALWDSCYHMQCCKYKNFFRVPASGHSFIVA